MKKICGCILTMVVFAMMIPGTCFVSKAENEIPSFGRINVNMPQIIVELRGGDIQAGDGDIQAFLDEEKLTVKNIYEYDAGKQKTCTYLLIDLSKSMKASFDDVKQKAIKYIDTTNDNNDVRVITFGGDKVEELVSNSGSKEDIKNEISSLECIEHGTVFYEALNYAYNLSSTAVNEYAREYALVFSDGEDVQKGSNTYNETSKLYKSHRLPIYAYCSSDASKKATNRFGELARLSGGTIYIGKDDNAFEQLLSVIQDVRIIELESTISEADGSTRLLSVKAGNRQLEQNIVINRAMEDKISPKIEEVYFDISKQVFVIRYSEKVKSADLKTVYSIVDGKDNQLNVVKVTKGVTDETYEIKTDANIKNGKYKINVSGVNDGLNEISEKDSTVTVAVDGIKKSNTVFIIIAIIVFIIVAILLVILILIKNKKVKKQAKIVEKEVEVPVYKDISDRTEVNGSVDYTAKHHVMSDALITIKLNITTGKSMTHVIETKLGSSLIVGRSSVCDIYIDDAKLSRQHFALEYDNGSVYVMDLQSRNGTMVNGIQINRKQPLRSGDKIYAGLSDIVIIYNR